DNVNHFFIAAVSMVRESHLPRRHAEETVAKFLCTYVSSHVLSRGAFRRVDLIHRHFRKIDYMLVFRHNASSWGFCFTHYHSPLSLCYQNHLCSSYLKSKFEASPTSKS